MSDENATLEFIVEGSSRRIPVARLKESFQAIARGLSGSLRDLHAVGDFELAEVVVEADVAADGSVRLLATRAGPAPRGAIALRFVQKGL